MKGVTVRDNETNETHSFDSMSEFCKVYDVNIGTFSLMVKENRTKTTKRTSPLNGKTVTVRGKDENDVSTYSFVPREYEKFITCECGSRCLRRDYQRHSRSKKHQQFEERKEIKE